MLFGAKQRVHSGRIPDHCDWPKMKESFDNVQTRWAWLFPKTDCMGISVKVVSMSFHLDSYSELHQHTRGLNWADT